MASKSDRQYFQNFIEAAEAACMAADYLVECLTAYDPERLALMLERMHGIEHTADGKKHEMSLALAKAFVTPFDREDLAELSQNIDEVTDAIEEILQRFYIHHIQKVTPESVEFARRLSGCCRLMKDMMEELERFKRPEKLHTLIVNVNHAEEDCDQFYLNAALHIRSQFTDAIDMFAWREIYDFMENCADACEHVADSVETIVMKNT